MTKDERQEIGIEKWKNNKGRGILNYVTGFGKTVVAIKIINRLFKKFGTTADVLIVVPTDILRNQWIQKIQENVPITFRDKITVNTIQGLLASYKNDDLKTYILGIVDEIHMMYSDLRSDYINKIFSRFLLGLSATPEDRENRHTSINNLPIIDTITEEEALSNNWIRPSVTYCVKLKLSDEDKAEYDTISTKIEQILEIFEKDHAALYACTGKNGYSYAHSLASKKGWNGKMEYALINNNKEELNRLGGIDYVTDINNRFNPKVLSSIAHEGIKLIAKRKLMLYNTPCKREAIIQLLNNYKDKKTIVFSQSVSFIKELGANINNRLYAENHNEVESGNIYLTSKGEFTTVKTPNLYKTKTNKPKKVGGDKIRAVALNDFSVGRINLMLSGVSGDAGTDVQDIKLVVVSSFTSNPTQYIQRKGRGVRLDGTDDLTVNVYLYISDTIEEFWLKSAMAKTNSSNIINWVNSIDLVEFSTKRKISYNI
jgi:superfamily II DNA or RNA helicase